MQSKGQWVSVHHPILQKEMSGVIICIHDVTKECYVHFIDQRFDMFFSPKEIETLPNQKEFSNRQVDLEAEQRQVKEVQKILIGNYEIFTWYISPFPQTFIQKHKLFICEKCLLYFSSYEDLISHQNLRNEILPPGQEIYREQNISIFEFEAKKQKLFCQTLCLIGKLFIKHKNLHFDIDNFRFYVLYEFDGQNYHLAGYFSREIMHSNNTLSCIVILPPYQSKGYGFLLADLSYEIARRVQMIGGPEQPLSEQGKNLFTKYWRTISLKILREHSMAISNLFHLSLITSINQQDLFSALNPIGLVQGENQEDPGYAIKYSKIDQVCRKYQNQIDSAKFINPYQLIWFGKKRG